MTLAARLLSAMRRRGIRSQNQLARLSGVSQPSVHRILADPQGYVPGRRIVARLAQALDMSEAWLADGCLPDSTPAPIPRATHLAPEPISDINRLVTLYAHLTSSQRSLVLDLARMLLEAGGTSFAAPPLLQRMLVRFCDRPGLGLVAGRGLTTGIAKQPRMAWASRSSADEGPPTRRDGQLTKAVEPPPLRPPLFAFNSDYMHHKLH